MNTALDAARRAAELARRDPTTANITAARAAVAAAVRMTLPRADSASAVSNGHGYNPYRSSDGKFGAGAHKERPKTGQRGGATAESAAGTVHAPAARAALTRAKTAAETARKSPTKENKAAARRAVGEASAASGRAPERKGSGPAKAAAKAKPREPGTESKQPSSLADAKITKLENLGGGLNSSYVATLHDGSKAVFKPASGEVATGVTAPVRTNIAAGTYYKREVASAKLAEQLGMKDMVPETVAVTHNGEIGSLQRWRPGGKLLFMEGDANGQLPGGARFDHESSERMRVFDYITGNSDRHAGNVIVDNSSGKPRPILIDHGLSFPNGPPDRFIQPTDAIHESRDLHPNTENMIKSLDIHGISKTLRDSGIEPEAIRHTLIRVKALQSDPSLIGTPWSSAAPDAWNLYSTDATRMVSKVDMKEIEDAVAGRR